MVLLCCFVFLCIFSEFLLIFFGSFFGLFSLYFSDYISDLCCNFCLIIFDYFVFSKCYFTSDYLFVDLFDF
jgi:hypothetical protein